METVEVQVIDFRKGPKYARLMGGRFNPITKTWTVPAHRPELQAPGAYGLTIVRRSGCPHYTPDQGCPLHGEFCAQ